MRFLPKVSPSDVGVYVILGVGIPVGCNVDIGAKNKKKTVLNYKSANETQMF